MHRRISAPLWGLLILPLVTPSAYATNNCVFSTVGTTMTLAADCATNATLTVPNGFTMNGGISTITVVDPPGGHFLGPVVKNGGPVANVVNLRITTSGLANICDGGAAGLRGIMFDGASGIIRRNTITNLNQGASDCPEGNAIEVQNFSTDGTIPAAQIVYISSNRVSAYQKTGIVCNGYVTCVIRGNSVGPSAVQDYQPVNSLQIAYAPPRWSRATTLPETLGQAVPTSRPPLSCSTMAPRERSCGATTLWRATPMSASLSSPTASPWITTVSMRPART